MWDNDHLTLEPIGCDRYVSIVYGYKVANANRK